MSEISIDLSWNRKEEELSPGKFSSEHQVTYNEQYKVIADTAPDWGGSANNTNPEQALAASLDNARRCFGERCAPPVAVAAAVAAEEAQDEEREQELKEESARCAGAAEPLCGCVPVSGAAGGVGCLSREELEKRRLA